MQQSPRGLFGRDRELAEADRALALAAAGTPQGDSSVATPASARRPW
jgi:hypothetical protein